MQSPSEFRSPMVTNFTRPRTSRSVTAGQFLTDEDRAPWLDAIAAWLDARSMTGGAATCSALKHAYRDRLRAGRALRFVYLHGSRDQLAERLDARRGHFFQSHMLESQLAVLEEPDPDEHIPTISIELTPAEIVDAILAR